MGQSPHLYFRRLTLFVEHGNTWLGIGLERECGCEKFWAFWNTKWDNKYLNSVIIWILLFGSSNNSDGRISMLTVRCQCICNHVMCITLSSFIYHILDSSIVDNFAIFNYSNVWIHFMDTKIVLGCQRPNELLSPLSMTNVDKMPPENFRSRILTQDHGIFDSRRIQYYNTRNVRYQLSWNILLKIAHECRGQPKIPLSKMY